jgi:hypothetical protein
VIVGALGYLAWQLRRPAPLVVVAPAAPATQPVAPEPRVAVAPSARRPTPASLPTEGPVSAPRELGQLTRNDVRQAQARLNRAAEPCVVEALKKNPSLGLRLHIKYTLIVEKGEGHAGNPTIVRSEIGDKAVEHCVMSKLREARWPVSGPDGVLPLGGSLSFKHLKRPHAVD